MSPNCPHCSLQVHADGTKYASTLSGQFRHSLDSLMKALSACHPFFIRCFKPNSNKQPKVRALISNLLENTDSLITS